MQHASNASTAAFRSRGRASVRFLLALWAGIPTQAAIAQDDSLHDWFSGGTVNFTLNPRYEYGRIDGFEESAAITLKTLLGYTTASSAGFSAKVEFTDTHALDDDAYNAAGLNGQPGKSVIADPETTELNQLYLDYAGERAGVRVGRQRYILDNARFIGNVGWRQNEQTFDAATLALQSGGFTFKGAYLAHINRIFADARDLDSASILLNASYQVATGVSLTGYYYHLDFDDAIVTTETVGAFVVGKAKASASVTFDYRAEAAFQTRDGADIDTRYYHLVLGVTLGGINLKAGYEVLGSDDGAGQFLTPLATAHAYNGFADTYLDNGGAGGLRDLYFSAGTKFGDLAMTGIYHFFESDEGDLADGSEFDAVLAYPLTPKVKALLKIALYDGDNLADRQRVVLQLTTSF